MCGFLRGAYCAAIAVNVAELMEKCVGLQNSVLVNRAYAAVEIAAERGKSDIEAHSAHFDIAFPQRPQPAECLFRILRQQHRVIFGQGKEPVGDAHHVVRSLDFFDIDAAFHIGDGACDDRRAG